MFKVKDFVKDAELNHRRNIYAARVIDTNINESGHEEVKLKIYDSSTGHIENIWVDQYRLRLMSNDEKSQYLSIIVDFYEQLLELN